MILKNRTSNCPGRKELPGRFFLSRPLFFVALALILSTSGCNYMSFFTRHATWKKVFENQPRLSLLQRFAPQESLLLTGRITNIEQGNGPLLVAAVSSQYRENEVVAFTTVHAPLEEYTMFLPAGRYELFLFADLNKNRLFERNEQVAKASSTVQATAGGSGSVEGPSMTADYNNPGTTAFRVRFKVRAANYVYSSLDDDFFDPKFGNEGLYNPAALLAHNQGFLFGLDTYDDRKTSILFVHGIGGTPRDWKYFVDGLDRSRFQPFFLYYPSGLPLDKLGSLLAQVIDSWDKSSVSGHKIVLAAHSMGGLVALSAIGKLAANGFPPSLRMYCSFSTPYGGDEAARKGVENAPVVVPVWRDIASDSDFLRDIRSLQMPKALPFYLFFTYRDPSTFKLGESSDGSVTLRSQLVPEIQASAIKLIGFNENHDGFLNSEPARREFLRLLDSVTLRKITPAAGSKAAGKE